MTFDSINRPAHYAEGRRFETIDVIEDWGLGFQLGNAVKYISRAGRKDPSALVEDLQKAVWYIQREIALLEEAPRAVSYEDVLEDQISAAEQAERLLFEYGYQDHDEEKAISLYDEWEGTQYDSSGVTAATKDDWQKFWDEFNPILTDTSVNLEPKSADLVSDEKVVISPEEVAEIIARKDLSQFDDDEIVSTVERRGLVIGFKKDGSSCVLNNGKCL